MTARTPGKAADQSARVRTHGEGFASGVHEKPDLFAVPEAVQPAWDIGQLVSDLRTARSSRNDWQKEEHERRQRPSRDALVAIVKGLRSALFPSHFGGGEISDTNVDFYVGHTLDSTLRLLQQQIGRVLHEVKGDEPQDPERVTRDLVRAFASTLPRVRTSLELDVRAAFEGDPAAQSRSEVIFCYPGVQALIHHRLAHELYQLGLSLIARVVAEIAHSETGIDIHPGAQIGESFFIDHGTGVVIGETAVIGNRVRLYQGVTLGARNFPKDDNGAVHKGLPRHPIIGDDVIIYAGATVLGRVTIGHSSTIGGNVWLTRSLPPHSVVTQAQTRVDAFDGGSGI